MGCGHPRDQKSLNSRRGRIEGATTYDPKTGKVLPEYAKKYYQEHLEEAKEGNHARYERAGRICTASCATISLTTTASA